MTNLANRRVLVVGAEPILREGLALLLRDAGAEVDVAVAGVADVVVVHMVSPADVLAVVPECAEAARIVVVHESFTPAQVDAACAAGIDALVDVASEPSALLAAVAGGSARSRVRWAPPGIGPAPLSRRERSVLTLVAAGYTSSDVARELGISTRTVEKHKQRVYERLGVTNQAQAVALAVRAGLLEPRTGAPVTAGEPRRAAL